MQKNFIKKAEKYKGDIERLMNRKRNIAPSKRFCWSKYRARKRGIPFELTKEQYMELIQLPCFYCDNELGSVQDSAGFGLDRLSNDKTIGYVVENVVPCCRQCNVLKNTLFTAEETKNAISEVLEERKCKRISTMLASLILA